MRGSHTSEPDSASSWPLPLLTRARLLVWPCCVDSPSTETSSSSSSSSDSSSRRRLAGITLPGMFLTAWVCIADLSVLTWWDVTCHYSREPQRVLSALARIHFRNVGLPTMTYRTIHSSNLDRQEVSRVSSGAMDFTYLAGVLPTSTQELVWWSCFSLLTLVVFKILLHSNAEDAIEFSVPVPEACRAGWEGKQLDEPSIKVCSDEEVSIHWGSCAKLQPSRYLAAQPSNATALQQRNRWALSTLSRRTALIESLQRPAKHRKNGPSLLSPSVDKS
jgi:hypothetical protein